MKQIITIDITKNTLSPSDIIIYPVPAPDGSSRSIRFIVRGKKLRDPEQPLKVEYEVSIDPKGFLGAWSEDEIRNVLKNYGEISVLTIDPNAGDNTVFTVETRADGLSDKNLVSPERIADSIAQYLMEFPASRKGGRIKYRTKFATVMEWLMFRGMLPPEKTVAREQMSVVTNLPYAKRLFTSQGGWLTLNDHANIHKTVARENIQMNPYYDPTKDNKIVVDWKKFTLGLHMLLDSLSNVVIINDKDKP